MRIPRPAVRSRIVNVVQASRIARERIREPRRRRGPRRWSSWPSRRSLLHHSDAAGAAAQLFTDRVDTKALGTEHAELNPELVALVRIAGVAEGRPLAVRGFINERGNPYSAASINSML